MLLRLKSPLTKILSSYQGGGRKGHTTFTQATALGTNFLQFDGERYVVLVDIVKAYPSTPHPLLWETMYRVGVSMGTIPRDDQSALVSPDSDPKPPLNPIMDSDPDDDRCATCWDHRGLENMPSIANPFATSFPCTLTCAGTCSDLTSLPGFAISRSSISQTGTWTCSLPDMVVHPFDLQCWALPVAPSCRYFESVRIASFGTQNRCGASSAAQSSAPLFVCLWRVGT